MPASDLAELAGFPVGGLLVLDIALHDVEGCSTGGDDGVGRGPEVIAPQRLFDLGPVVGTYPHRGDGLQRHHQPGQGHFRWVGHEQVGVVLVRPRTLPGWCRTGRRLPRTRISGPLPRARSSLSGGTSGSVRYAHEACRPHAFHCANHHSHRPLYTC